MRLAVPDKRADLRCRGPGPDSAGPEDRSGRICTECATHAGPAAPCGGGVPPDPARRPAAIGAAADSTGLRALHAHAQGAHIAQNQKATVPHVYEPALINLEINATK